MKRLMSLILITSMLVTINISANAAAVKPIIKAITSTKSEYKPGDIVAFDVSAANYGTKKVQYRIILSAPGKTTDTLYNNKLSYMGESSYRIRIPVHAVGNYTVSVFVKRAGVNVSYDNYITISFKVVNPTEKPVVKTTQNTADPLHDINNLKANADFNLKVAEGVNWVPANTLGKPSMTIEEMKKLVESSPDELKDRVKTVYDVIMYIRIANFKNSNDNVKGRKNGIEIEYHTKGPEAVKNNEGCCATISALANFLLEGDYPEMGYIQQSQLDGSGHVYNYIKYKDKYYAIDYTHYRNDSLNYTSIESGNISDYYKSDFIAGNIHEMVNIKDYVAYIRATYKVPPAFFAMYQTKDVANVGAYFTTSGMVKLYFPSQTLMNVLYDDLNDSLSINFVEWLE